MFHWILVLAYAIFIFYLSSQPYLGVPSEIVLLDSKLSLHLIEYMLLGVLLARAVSKTEKLVLGKPFLLLLLILGSTYGLGDELHQFFVPGRTASIFDAGADTLGVALGVVLWIGWMHLQQGKAVFKKESENC